MTEQRNPEVLRLLSEILGDDEALLTRVSKIRPSHFAETPISAGEPFLSKGERHLLRWHREEVGRLLYEGCVLALQSNPVESTTVFARDVVEEAGWDRTLGRVLRSSNAAWPQEREALRRPDEGGRFRSSWARLAGVIRPSDDVAIAEACALYAEGEIRGARTIAERVAARSCNSHKRSTARSVLAKCHYGVGDLDLALVGYRATALEQDPDPTGALLWFAHAVRVGDCLEVERAVARMRDTQPIPASVVASSVSVLVQERRSGKWCASPGCLPRSVEDQLSETAWKVLDAVR